MNHDQHTGSTAALLWGTIATIMFGVLPAVLTCIAALTGTAWSVLMIYESVTVQHWLRARGSKWALNYNEGEHHD
jgi:hypothetical protein